MRGQIPHKDLRKLIRVPWREVVGGSFESHELAVFADSEPAGIAHAAGKKLASQLSLFAISNENAIDELRGLDIENLSADETREILKNVKNKIV